MVLQWDVIFPQYLINLIIGPVKNKFNHIINFSLLLHIQHYYKDDVADAKPLIGAGSNVMNTTKGASKKRRKKRRKNSFSGSGDDGSGSNEEPSQPLKVVRRRKRTGPSDGSGVVLRVKQENQEAVEEDFNVGREDDNSRAIDLKVHVPVVTNPMILHGPKNAVQVLLNDVPLGSPLEGGGSEVQAVEEDEHRIEIYCKKVRQAQQAKMWYQQQQQQQQEQQQHSMLQQQKPVQATATITSVIVSVTDESLKPPHTFSQPEIPSPSMLSQMSAIAARARKRELVAAARAAKETDETSLPGDDFIIPRERVISICNMDKDALDDYLQLTGDNSQEAEIMQYFDDTSSNGQSTSTTSAENTEANNSLSKSSTTTTTLNASTPMLESAEGVSFAAVQPPQSEQNTTATPENQLQQLKQCLQMSSIGMTANNHNNNIIAKMSATDPTIVTTMGGGMPYGSAAASLTMMSQRHALYSVTSAPTHASYNGSGMVGMDLSQEAMANKQRLIDGSATAAGQDNRDEELRRHCNFVPIALPQDQQQQQQSNRSVYLNVSNNQTPQTLPLEQLPIFQQQHEQQSVDMLGPAYFSSLKSGKRLSRHSYAQLQSQQHILQQQQQSLNSSGSSSSLSNGMMMTSPSAMFAVGGSTVHKTAFSRPPLLQAQPLLNAAADLVAPVSEAGLGTAAAAGVLSSAGQISRQLQQRRPALNSHKETRCESTSSFGRSYTNGSVSSTHISNNNNNNTFIANNNNNNDKVPPVAPSASAQTIENRSQSVPLSYQNSPMSMLSVTSSSSSMILENGTMAAATIGPTTSSWYNSTRNSNNNIATSTCASMVQTPIPADYNDFTEMIDDIWQQTDMTAAASSNMSPALAVMDASAKSSTSSFKDNNNNNNDDFMGELNNGDADDDDDREDEVEGINCRKAIPPASLLLSSPGSGNGGGSITSRSVPTTPVPGPGALYYPRANIMGNNHYVTRRAYDASKSVPTTPVSNNSSGSMDLFRYSPIDVVGEGRGEGGGSGSRGGELLRRSSSRDYLINGVGNVIVNYGAADGPIKTTAGQANITAASAAASAAVIEAAAKSSKELAASPPLSDDDDDAMNFDSMLNTEMMMNQFKGEF